MNRKISVSMAVTLAIIAMMVTFSITMIMAMRMFDNTVSSVNEKESQYTKLSEVDRYVRSNEFFEINDESLNDMISSGYMLGTGDKYARYYTAKAYSDYLNIQSGKTMGIGVDVVNDASSGYARITRVYDDSPAADLGLQVGGYLTSINEIDVKTLTTTDAINAALRGEEGTSAAFWYLDPSMTENEFEITRRSYVVPTVNSAILDSTGYVSINDFATDTPTDFSYEVNRLLSAGITNLVVDLRGNSSTNLIGAMSCIDVLAPEGDMGFALYKSGKRTLLDKSDENHVGVSIVCLVNGTTSNAAELFAADVQQMAGGRIVGERTAGKGVVMSDAHRMSDGSAVIITAAQLLTSDGTTFDGTGVSLDNEASLSTDETIRLGESVSECDSQLQKAVSVAQNLAANRS